MGFCFTQETFTEPQPSVLDYEPPSHWAGFSSLLPFPCPLGALGTEGGEGLRSCRDGSRAGCGLEVVVAAFCSSDTPIQVRSHVTLILLHPLHYPSRGTDVRLSQLCLLHGFPRASRGRDGLRLSPV